MEQNSIHNISRYKNSFINIGNNLINMNTITQITREKKDKGNYFNVHRIRSPNFTINEKDRGYNYIEKLFSMEHNNKSFFINLEDRLININTIDRIEKSEQNKCFYLFGYGIQNSIAVYDYHKEYNHIENFFSSFVVDE